MKLHSALKKKGFNPANAEWFADAIEKGIVKLPELQDEYRQLQDKVQGLQNKFQDIQYKIQGSERHLQYIQQQIMKATDVENMHHHNIATLGDKLYNLQNEIHHTEQFVSRYKNTDKKYLKIKSIAEQIVNRLLTEQGPLLTSVIIAVVQALRVNPDKYAIIFGDSEYDNNSEYHEGLLEVASSFLKMLSWQMVDKTMVAAAAVKGE